MLVKRNLLLFFRDKSAVFFSLLSVIIIVGLYALFLGDVMEQSLQAALGFESDKIAVVIASITLAGMIAVTSVTSCLGALEVGMCFRQRKSKKRFPNEPCFKEKNSCRIYPRLGNCRVYYDRCRTYNMCGIYYFKRR
jgi:multidrug/hemolysin transport system permease protein